MYKRSLLAACLAVRSVLAHDGPSGPGPLSPDQFYAAFRGAVIHPADDGRDALQRRRGPAVQQLRRREIGRAIITSPRSPRCLMRPVGESPSRSSRRCLPAPIPCNGKSCRQLTGTSRAGVSSSPCWARRRPSPPACRRPWGRPLPRPRAPQPTATEVPAANDTTSAIPPARKRCRRRGRWTRQCAGWSSCSRPAWWAGPRSPG